MWIFLSEQAAVTMGGMFRESVVLALILLGGGALLGLLGGVWLGLNMAGSKGRHSSTARAARNKGRRDAGVQNSSRGAVEQALPPSPGSRASGGLHSQGNRYGWRGGDQ
jgi:hypothetical protein